MRRAKRFGIRPDAPPGVKVWCLHVKDYNTLYNYMPESGIWSARDIVDEIIINPPNVILTFEAAHNNFSALAKEVFDKTRLESCPQ